MGAIVKLNESTKLVNSMKVVQKPNKIKECVDPTNLNVALQRSHYLVKTIDDRYAKCCFVLTELNVHLIDHGGRNGIKHLHLG